MVASRKLSEVSAVPLFCLQEPLYARPLLLVVAKLSLKLFVLVFQLLVFVAKVSDRNFDFIECFFGRASLQVLRHGTDRSWTFRWHVAVTVVWWMTVGTYGYG